MEAEVQQIATPPANPPKPGRSIALSSFFMIVGRLGMRGIGIISTLVLVRILSPKDFGIVALAQAIYPMLDLLTATGFNLAIIRMRDPDIAHYDTAWTLGVVRGALIAAGLIATSGLQARFMHEPRIQPIMWVVAATAFMNSLQNVRLVDYQRGMRFDLLTLWMLWGKAQVFIITMLLAIFIQNYWILVLGNLISKFFSIPAGYIIAPHRPRFSLAGWHDLFHFSKWLFLGNICVLADQQLMNFTVGHYLGMNDVGLFQVGAQIAGLPVTELAAPMRGPFYSGLARIHENVLELGHKFLEGLAAQCAIVVPLTVGVAICTPEVVAIFLGNKWLAVATILPIIAGYQFFDAVGHFVHTIMMVTNRQRLYTFTYYASITVRVPVTVWAATRWGLFGASCAMLATAAFNAVIWTAQVNRILAFPWWKELAVCWRSLGASAVMAAGVILLADYLRGHDAPVYARFLLETLAGGALYFGFHWLFWTLSGRPRASPEAHAANMLRSVLQRGKSLGVLRGA